MRGLIVGLPRSRTAWLSAYFSAINPFGSNTHEAVVTEFGNRPARYADAASDWQGWIDCTTWYDAVNYIPRDTPIIYVQRNIRDVEDSLNAMEDVDLPTGTKLALAHVTCLDASQADIPFADLDTELPFICRCFGLPYDEDIHYRFKNLNIQTTRTRL